MKKAPLRLAQFRPVYFTTMLFGSLVVLTGCHDEQKTSNATVIKTDVESSCADGEDNDADGAPDCDDTDCQSPGGECVAAPDLDRTVATTLAESAAYLYQGENPLQKAVTKDAIDSRRIATLRGRAIDAQGKLLAGVKITVKGHSEYGYTYTRGDGLFDMAVNGGARLVLNYELSGHLSVQRTTQPGWQRYVTIADAGLVAVATKSSKVPADSIKTQVIEGEPIADNYGARQPLVVMEPETRATAMLAEGKTQELSELSISVTEYPITENQEYLPGSVTSNGGLSYGLEFAVKEADALGAEHVAFSQQVSVYVENLAELDVGRKLTVQHYDRGAGQWEPGVNGSVIELLDVADGIASIDTDGDGEADEQYVLDEQGITESDRRELAKRYEAGQKLWHGEMRHFSAGLLQAQGKALAGAVAPVRRGLVTKTLDNPNYRDGMVIESQASTHNEPITGTPFTLHYQSNRTMSYGAGRILEVPLVGETLPTGLIGINVQIKVAGRTYEASYPTSTQKLTPNLRFSAKWDGKDAAKRVTQGQQLAQVTIAYVYRDATNKNLKAILPVSFDVALGGWDARAFQLGGFALNAFHAYDPAQQIVYFGHGGQRSGANVSLVAKPASNNETFELGTPDSLTVASDGSLIFTDDQQDSSDFGRVIQIVTDGTPRVLFGEGAIGEAATVQMTQPQGVVVMSDGRLIVADIYDERIIELNTDGSIRVLVSGNEADAPVLLQPLDGPTGLALGPREELYFVDADKVYRYEAGQVAVFAGGGTETGDGVDATQSKLIVPSGLAVDKDGNVYVSERGEVDKAGGHRVRKISPNGVITTVAGNGSPGYSGDGDVAIGAQLNNPHGLALDDEGQLYIVDQGNNRIRRISADGLIQTVIGGGDQSNFEGAMAVNVKLNAPDGIAAGPDGALYIATKDTVLRTFVGMPKVSQTDHLVPSIDGRTLYRFDARGKHLETIDAVTGVTELSFAYDSAGLLATITDKNANVTKIEREDGKPTAIVAPHGQRTLLKVNDAGDVAEITDPISRTTKITWENEKYGLVSKVEDPKEQATTYSYDPTGRMLSTVDPTGYATTLARTEVDNGWFVAVTTANGNVTGYTTQYGANRWIRTVTHPDQTKTVVIDSGASLERRSPDGTKQTVTFNPDTSFGAQVLVPYEDQVTLPSGKVLVSESSRTKTMADIQNPLDVEQWLEETSVNDRWYSVNYNRGTRTLTQTSPSGRSLVVTLDELGRPAELTGSGAPTTKWQYNGYGQVTTVTRQASSEKRVQTYDYDDNGWSQYFTDAIGGKTTYGRDLVGRLTSLISPDEAKTYWELDNADNVFTLTPPGRPETRFGYDDKSKLLTSVAPPPVEVANAGNVSFAYGKENELKTLTRADGKTIGFAYDSWGRLKSQTFGSASISYGYEKGHLTRVAHSNGVTLSQAFDGALWTSSSWSGAIQGSIKATYNSNLWLSSLTVNSASTVSFGYDDDGLLTSATATVGGITLSRDEVTGNVTGTTLANTTSVLGYSDFGELSHISAAFSGASLFEQNIAERDALGRIRHLTETVGGVAHDVAYEYELSGRLAKETRDGITTVYSYDLSGNRTSVQVGSNAAVTASYDEQDRILGYGAAKYTHDAQGDLQTRTDGTKTSSYSYDELGNLLKVVLEDGTAKKTVEYVVDGLGRRVARRVDGKFDRAWLYRDALRPIAEIDANGVFTHFVYTSNVAESGAPIALIREGVFYRFVTDHLGSVRLVVNATTGAVVQSVDYDAYGRVVSETGTGFQPFGFAGGLYDAVTGLTRFGARDYDPETGRWTDKDPLLFGGKQTNLYVYAGNDPVNRRDPSGLEPTSDPLTAPFTTYFEASDLAEAHFHEPAGGLNGQGDAYRHCLASCWLTQNVGETYAGFFGWLNEQVLRDPDPAECKMDNDNNRRGREFGKDSNADCSLSCLGAAISGGLTTLQ